MTRSASTTLRPANRLSPSPASYLPCTLTTAASQRTNLGHWAQPFSSSTRRQTPSGLLDVAARPAPHVAQLYWQKVQEKPQGAAAAPSGRSGLSVQHIAAVASLAPSLAASRTPIGSPEGTRPTALGSTLPLPRDLPRGVIRRSFNMPTAVASAVAPQLPQVHQQHDISPKSSYPTLAPSTHAPPVSAERRSPSGNSINGYNGTSDGHSPSHHRGEQSHPQPLQQQPQQASTQQSAQQQPQRLSPDGKRASPQS